MNKYAMMANLPDRLEEVITSEEYHVFPDSMMTVCVLTLVNGSQVVGSCPCLEGLIFNESRTREIAREKARAQIAEHEEYLRRQRLFEDAPSVQWAKEEHY